MKASEWKWFGNAGHLIVSQWCRFHLCTQVGDYLISTVGEYVHPSNSGASELSEGVWLAANPLGEPIGAGKDSLFETMVFKAGKPCSAKECGCGLPQIDGHELDCERYSNRRDANAGHMAFCQKYAAKKAARKTA